MNRCEVDLMPDPTGLPRSVCGRRAKNSLRFKSAEWMRNNRYIFRLCDECFDKLQEESVTWGLAEGKEQDLKYLFRKNKL